MNKMLIKMMIVFCAAIRAEGNQYHTLIQEARQYVFEQRKEQDRSFAQIVENKNERMASNNAIDASYEGLLDVKDAQGIFVEYVIAGIADASRDSFDMMEEVKDHVKTQYATFADRVDGRDVFLYPNQAQLVAIFALIEEYQQKKLQVDMSMLRENLKRLPSVHTESGYCELPNDQQDTEETANEQEVEK